MLKLKGSNGYCLHSRLQNYEAQAAKRGNHQAALRAVELQARLLRFELS